MLRRTFVAATAVSAVIPAATYADAAAWTKAAPLPINIQEIYPAVHQGQLIVAGGIAARLAVPYFTNRVFAYEPNDNRWRELPSLPEDLHHIALVSDGQTLMGIGGFNGGYSEVWRMRDQVYQLTETGWVVHSQLPTPQAEGVATYHNKYIHVVTGQQPRGAANSQRSDHEESSLHWVWDGDAWRDATPIPTPRNSATGGWIDDQLIVTGGRTAKGNLDVTEIYDAKTDRWQTAAPMPLPQAGTASVVSGRSLLVFGGEIFVPKADVFANVWRYDLDKDQWRPMPDLPTPRHGLGAGLIDNRVYVIGGATEPSGNGTSDRNEVLVL